MFSPGDPTQGPEFCMMPSIIGPEGGALPVVDCPIRHGRPPRLSRSHHRRALSVQSSDALFRSPSALFDRLSNERSRKPTQRRATQSIRHLYAAMRFSSNAILWTTTSMIPTAPAASEPQYPLFWCYFGVSLRSIVHVLPQPVDPRNSPLTTRADLPDAHDRSSLARVFSRINEFPLPDSMLHGLDPSPIAHSHNARTSPSAAKLSKPGNRGNCCMLKPPLARPNRASA